VQVGVFVQSHSAVRKDVVLKTFGYLKSPPTYDIPSLLTRFEKGVVSIRTPAAIRLAPQVVLELLVDLTFLMHALATELHGELIDRHSLDGRWRAARQRFLRNHGLFCDTGLWPC
jgi:hypothetical protein